MSTPGDVKVEDMCPRCRGLGAIASNAQATPWAYYLLLPADHPAKQGGPHYELVCQPCGGTGVGLDVHRDLREAPPDEPQFAW